MGPASTSNNLRRQIVKSTNNRSELRIIFRHPGQTKIDDFNPVRFIVDQHVLWLDVTMDNAILVNVVESIAYILQVVSNLRFFKQWLDHEPLITFPAIVLILDEMR
jgi:hypothetical protein